MQSNALLRNIASNMFLCFLDVLSITNILSLILQSDKKHFVAVRRAMQLTCLQLRQMRDNSKSSLLKS